MRIDPTEIPEVRLIVPRRFSDDRGFFAETYNARAFAEAGLPTDWAQDNHSLSHPVGTVRGLHFQAPPHAQAKLVRCGQGRLFDVAVDIRRGSPTYGRWVGAELSAENGHMMFIPEGFLHGFVTREPGTEVVYKCTALYAPAADGAVRFDDPGIGIDWGIGPDRAILSPKDAAAPLLADFDTPFVWEAA